MGLIPDNDNGYVVWYGGDGHGDYEIFLGVPCSLNDDNDDDGYVSASCGGDDCHDSNPNIYPTNSNTYCNCEDPYPKGTNEICGDGVDNDCKGTADDKDQDNDGYIDEECTGDDCDDSTHFVHPGATEICDGIDNQCRGDVGHGQSDERCPSCAANVAASTYQDNPVYGASDLARHLVYFLFPLVAVITISICRRKK